MAHPALSGLLLVALVAGGTACCFGLAHLPTAFWCGAAAALSACAGSACPLPPHFKRPPRVARNARGRAYAGQDAGLRAELAVTVATTLSLGAGVAAWFLSQVRSEFLLGHTCKLLRRLQRLQPQPQTLAPGQALCHVGA